MRRASALLVAAFALGAAASVPARSDLAITGVTLVDGRGGPPRPGVTVLVRGERVAAVGERLRPPRGVPRLDGRGRFLMPGLMDVHIHLVGAGQWRGLSNPPGVEIDEAAAREALRGYLYWGVTSVYDAGNDPRLSLALRARERAGEIESPRIFASGHALSYPGSWMAGSFHGIGVPDWPATQAVLDAQVASQPDLQKIVIEGFGLGPNPAVPQLPAGLVQKMVAYLHERGVRTTVHATTEANARVAAAAGIDTFAHPVGTARMSEPFVAQLAAARKPIATTLAVFDEIIRLGEDPGFLDAPLYSAVLSADEIAARKAFGPPRYAALGWSAWFKALMPYYRENVRRLAEAGAVLAVATDRSDGATLHRELELLAEAGLPGAQIVTMATLNGARFLGREAELGSVEPGKLADLLLLDADPTADVQHLRRIVAVVKGGRVVARQRLDLPVNRRPAPVAPNH